MGGLENSQAFLLLNFSEFSAIEVEDAMIIAESVRERDRRGPLTSWIPCPILRSGPIPWSCSIIRAGPIDWPCLIHRWSCCVIPWVRPVLQWLSWETVSTGIRWFEHEGISVHGEGVVHGKRSSGAFQRDFCGVAREGDLGNRGVPSPTR